MKIECLLRRPGGSKIDLGDAVVHFAPDPNDPAGPHVAEVASQEHQVMLLRIPEAYRPLEEVPPEVTHAVLSLGTRQNNIRQFNREEHLRSLEEYLDNQVDKPNEGTDPLDPTEKLPPIESVDLEAADGRTLADRIRFELDLNPDDKTAIREYAEAEFGVKLHHNLQLSKAQRGLLLAYQDSVRKDLAEAESGDYQPSEGSGEPAFGAADDAAA